MKYRAGYLKRELVKGFGNCQVLDKRIRRMLKVLDRFENAEVIDVYKIKELENIKLDLIAIKFKRVIKPY